jgi:hypothetical protein
VARLGWRPTDPAETIPISVRWHLAHPPADPDQDFDPDDRALAAAGQGHRPGAPGADRRRLDAEDGHVRLPW